MMMRSDYVLLIIFANLVATYSSRFGLGNSISSLRLPFSKSSHQLQKARRSYGIAHACRGGGETNEEESTSSSDEERYSRQVYTLGARAHKLVRSCTIYVDGPQSSGLVYECCKNLALSGVGHIVVLTNDDDNDNDNDENIYHDSTLDDLGQTYTRGAQSELDRDNKDPPELLVEYIQRLNPSVDVSKKSRGDFISEQTKETVRNGILLCLDRRQSTQLSLNKGCRKWNMPFVAVETAGVFGRTFCDFGSSFKVFDIDGETPKVIPLDHLELLQENGDILVHCVEGEKHDVSKGDTIEFQSSTGEKLEPQCSVLKVLSPGRFIVSCLSSDNKAIPEEFVQMINSHITSFNRVKVPSSIKFMPLDEALENSKENDSLFAQCDLDKSWDPVRKCALLSCFEALETFVKEYQRLPTIEDAEEFETMASRSMSAQDNLVNESRFKQIVRSFARCSAAKFTPIQAVFAAIGAQEALKAASGLYNPVQQFLLYDCDELLELHDKIGKSYSEESTTAPGQSYILGDSLTKSLSSKRLFLVGAGAIGCELLKNLAAMGAGTGKKGCIIVTDMDTIEQSNLSRQLLFRDGNIGQFKSMAAHEAVLRLNPNVNMEAHTSKVGDGESGPFDDSFWSKGIDMVLNALDNVEARLYMDGQCVANEKALIDAGTLGSKGNVQVVIPHQSESYGSSVDPPEPAIAVCTLKNFPYAIAHTIQWGRDLFDGLYQRRPSQVNEYSPLFSKSTVDEFAKLLNAKLGSEAALEAASELKDDLSLEWIDEESEGSIRKKSIEWAADLARKFFYDSVDDLLREHPVESVDEDGEPFWSGTRRVPKKLSYNSDVSIDNQQETINENLVEFVRNAARLRIETYASQSLNTMVSVEEAVSALGNSDWSKKETFGSPSNVTEAVDNAIAEIVDMLSSLDPISNQVNLNVVEFEKDEESNGHVAFVTAASNLRALCYNIPPVDAMETRRVAGRIVPAMITTTAFVSALSCIEMLKLILNSPLKYHRNAFINLALPFFAFTGPLPAEEMPGPNGKTYTLWDSLVVKEGKKSWEKGGMKLSRFLQRVKKKACPEDPDSIDISTIAFGPYMIYANFLHEDDKEMLNRPLWLLLKEAVESGDEFDDEFSRADSTTADETLRKVDTDSLEQRKFVDLTIVVVEEDTANEIELPPLRFVKWKS